MKLLLKNARIFDPSSIHHGEIRDILIEDGVIQQIGEDLAGQEIWDLESKMITPGFVDLFAHFNEPGFEHKEDISSGIEAALSGGFTDVCLIPNTHPVVETKSDVRYFISRSGKEIDLYPIGAVSEGARGENLTEILDLNQAGAIAFSDGLHPIWNAELLLKALQYVQKFDGLIIDRAKDIHLAQFSQMHEGEVSTSLGMKGEPALSEEIALKKSLDILKYAGGRMHFTHLSTAKGVDLIKNAKKEGLRVTCDVAIHQLLYTDRNLMDFDANYKVDPPFRTERDRKALINGLKTGVIDAIVSSHQPQDVESKELEFDLADPGICSLPTVYSSLISIMDELPLDTSISKITAGPRKILNMPEVKIEVGNVVKLAVFDDKKEWKLDASTNSSKSKNTPMYNTSLVGKCIGTINRTTINR